MGIDYLSLVYMIPGRIGDFNGSVNRHGLTLCSQVSRESKTIVRQFMYVYVGFASWLKVRTGALLWACCILHVVVCFALWMLTGRAVQDITRYKVFCPLCESPPRLHYAPKPVEFREVGGPLWRKFPAQPHIDENCGKKVAVKSLWPIITFQTLRCFSMKLS